MTSQPAMIVECACVGSIYFDPAKYFGCMAVNVSNVYRARTCTFHNHGCMVDWSYCDSLCTIGNPGWEVNITQQQTKKKENKPNVLLANLAQMNMKCVVIHQPKFVDKDFQQVLLHVH